ncbi:MAG: ATP-binding protein [Endomicrobia bacterium]|nr:ATP-binding protein [Endomicrobiia bacterium]
MLKNIVGQQKEERDLLLSKNYQKRISVDKTTDFLNSGLIKLITGPRRAGKSVFALQILSRQNFAYLNFDDDLLLKNFDEDLLWQYLLEAYPDFNFLLLDEVQNLPGWDIWVSKLYRRGVNLVITGSNAKLLSTEMATALTGRYVQIQILPFSFNEMLEYKKIGVSSDTPAQKAATMLELEDFLQNGGYPETILARGLARNYLSSLFDSILLKDIAKRFKVRNTDELYSLANWLLANFANAFSLNRLAQDLNLGSVHTAQKYCKYLEEPFLFCYLPRYDSKLKIMQKAAKKIYLIDTGFVRARAFELSKNTGRLLENLVFVELLRRGFSAVQSLFYYRTRNDREIDFVCRQANQVSELIQVSYDISNPKTIKREVSALIEASDELNCQNLTILTWNNRQIIEERNKKINVIPVWEWLIRI